MANSEGHDRKTDDDPEGELCSNPSQDKQTNMILVWRKKRFGFDLIDKTDVGLEWHRLCAHAARNHHTVALLQNLNNLDTYLILKNGASLHWLCPVSAVPAGGSQSASVKVNALSCEFPAQFGILMVEVLDCITEAIAIPVHDDHIAIDSSQVLHLLVDVFPDVWWHDANCVADADDHLWAALHIPFCREIFVDQIDQPLSIADKVPDTLLVLWCNLLPAVLDEVGVEVHSARVPSTWRLAISMGEQRHQSLTSATSNFDKQRSRLAVATEIVTQLAHEIRGVNEKFREETPGSVHGITPLLNTEVFPLAALVIVWLLDWLLNDLSFGAFGWDSGCGRNSNVNDPHCEIRGGIASQLKEGLRQS